MVNKETSKSNWKIKKIPLFDKIITDTNVFTYL